jgi:hypothetical protein
VVLNHSNASHKDLQTLYLIFDKNLKSQQQSQEKKEYVNLKASLLKYTNQMKKKRKYNLSDIWGTIK